MTDPRIQPSELDQLPDRDPEETAEWQASLDAVTKAAGPHRAAYLMRRTLERAEGAGLALPKLLETDYVNSIPTSAEPVIDGDEAMESRITAWNRWNAAAMVTRGSKYGVGGHIATFASAAWLYETGFNHFFHGKEGDGSGDQLYIQGHASPGIYARAFLDGRLGEQQLDNFRQEAGGDGLPSYPHPRRLPWLWEFPTVSMGLGPLSAIYQARFNRYLTNRGIKDVSSSHVWAFLGDGEMDEPESTAALALAAREELDNLTFVINCNLQRLDGPVRGNGKIIQELEGLFRGAGWNVIKLVWGSDWPFAAFEDSMRYEHAVESLTDWIPDAHARRIIGGDRLLGVVQLAPVDVDDLLLDLQRRRTPGILDLAPAGRQVVGGRVTGGEDELVERPRPRVGEHRLLGVLGQGVHQAESVNRTGRARHAVRIGRAVVVRLGGEALVDPILGFGALEGEDRAPIGAAVGLPDGGIGVHGVV